jgi:hypothetical protein
MPAVTASESLMMLLCYGFIAGTFVRAYVRPGARRRVIFVPVCYWGILVKNPFHWHRSSL